ncbi:unnamed protein product [Mytilus coruscus]|uniref:Uncharacterized protein n=1 Tax=Mytilus coruscus TaxID=42192 RepID=A0A6J8C748_MYTCO|nr:unnamed protein product [Mytilus coruscus]
MAVSGTKENSFKVVAAIDIGTPFSTYAYSTEKSFQTDPLDIHQVKTWYSDSNRKGITKTVTCLLLDRNLRFVAFGNDAQEEYAQLKHLKKSSEYLFFRHFNLQLYESEEPIKRLQLKDLDGNGKASAKRVYATTIMALKTELLQQFETDDRLLNDADIRWILSTPVAFSEDSSSFMKECAKQAGILTEQLSIVYEPEAVSIYLHYLCLPNKADTLEYEKKLRMSSDEDAEIFRRINTNYIIVKIAGCERRQDSGRQLDKDDKSWSTGLSKDFQTPHEKISEKRAYQIEI